MKSRPRSWPRSWPRFLQRGRNRWSRIATAIALIPLLISGAWAQTPSLPGLPQTLPSALTKSATADVETGKVRLDGQNLFTIAAPTLAQNARKGGPTPLQERIEGIETQLERIANSDFDPKQLKVSAAIDQRSNLPVLSVNDQYLMTVTTLDAQIQVQPPDRWADQLAQKVKSALVQAHQERQPGFLAYRGIWAAGILLAVVGVSWATANWRRRLKAKQKSVEAQLPTASELSAAATPPITQPDGEASKTALTAIRQQQRQQRRRNLSDMQNRLLQVAQLGVWVGGLFAILGLFPYTRWLQPFVLSTPLKILAIALGGYILIRISYLLVDRFAEALVQEDFIDPKASQRLALRISTFSRVLKSGAAVLWIVTGVWMSLSVIGVDLIPLLAGAGLIGLAISFAAQSLIKDMINGLLILFEDQYAVGDVIAVGAVSGFVENMNLRITQLRNSEGQLITIPNSSITIVQNLSKDWSRVDLGIDLAYGTDPDRALNVIRRLAQEIYNDPEWHAKMPDPPEVLGIDEVNHDGLLVRVWIKTLPLQQWSVAREFRRRLALVLDQEGLAIAVPQQSLWFKSGLEVDIEKLESLESDRPDRVADPERQPNQTGSVVKDSARDSAKDPAKDPARD